MVAIFLRRLTVSLFQGFLLFSPLPLSSFLLITMATATATAAARRSSGGGSSGAATAIEAMAAIRLIEGGRIEITPFQRRVYLALCEVPAGMATTYKELAAKVGCGSCQAIGQALKRNPYAPTVPCHRVVKSDGSLGGFGGAVIGDKIEKKRRMLEEEGVKFDGEDENGDAGNGWAVRRDCIYAYSPSSSSHSEKKNNNEKC